MLLALILFILTYVLMLLLPKQRMYVAVCSAVLFIAFGILRADAAIGAIDWNIIMMLAGTMGTVSLFIESKMPALMADYILERTHSLRWTVVALSVFAGLISAFVDNVATVLMVAPVALTAAKKLKISPVPIIIAIALSSNQQGAATLVGDTTSIMLGSYAGMDFFDFFVFMGKPGLFWVIEISAFASALVIAFLFRKDDSLITVGERTKVTDFFPTWLLLATIVLLICASFVPGKPQTTNGLICTGVFALGLIRELLRKNKSQARRVLKEIDYSTIFLLAGLFVVIEGITEAGVIDAVSDIFVWLSGDSIFLAYTLIVWASVLLSAFIDNIPYVATMLPVVQGMALTMGINPYILYFGLLIGATLGGNLTPIGASANITALGILRRDGYEVKLGEFMRIGVPVTLVAVVTGYILIWLIWA